MPTSQEEKTEMLLRTIELLQEQNKLLRAGITEEKQAVEYPAKPGALVLMPPDKAGKRFIRIVPNEELGIANLFSVPGVEIFEGEVPIGGFIIETIKHRVHTEPLQTKPQNDIESDSKTSKTPEDFKTNRPKVLNENERVAAVVAAILSLKKDDFNKSGYPTVNALTTVVGFQVEAKERDRAFERFKESQPDWVMPTA